MTHDIRRDPSGVLRDSVAREVASILRSALSCAESGDLDRVVWRAVDAAGIAASSVGWPADLAGIEPTGRGYRLARSMDR